MTPRFVQADVMTNWNGEKGYMVTKLGGRRGYQKISGITSTVPISVSLTRSPLFSDAVKIMLVRWMCSENNSKFTATSYISYFTMLNFQGRPTSSSGVWRAYRFCDPSVSEIVPNGEREKGGRKDRYYSVVCFCNSFANGSWRYVYPQKLSYSSCL